jgi:hypothetical protein
MNLLRKKWKRGKTCGGSREGANFPRDILSKRLREHLVVALAVLLYSLSPSAHQRQIRGTEELKIQSG